MRLVFRLAVAVVGLITLLLTALVRPDTGYAVRGGSIGVALLGSVAIIFLVVARLRAVPAPGRAPAGRSPEAVVTAALKRGRKRIARLLDDRRASSHRRRRQRRVQQVEAVPEIFADWEDRLADLGGGRPWRRAEAEGDVRVDYEGRRRPRSSRGRADRGDARRCGRR